MRHQHIERAVAGVVAAFGFVAPAMAVVQNVSWIAPGSGIWHAPDVWSMAPSYPLDTPPAGTSYVVDLPAHASPYTVNVETHPVVDGISIGANATLAMGRMTLGNVMTVHDGGHVRFGGTLTGGRIITQGTASLEVGTQGSFNGVNVDGLITASGGTYVEFDAASQIGSNGEIRLNGSTLESRGGVLQGAGTVRMNGSGSKITPGFDGSQTLVLPSSLKVIVDGSGSFSATGGVSNSATIEIGNGGFFEANRSTQAAIPFANHGSIRAFAGGGLVLPFGWTNDGTIAVENGRVDVSSVPASAGAFTVRASSVSVRLSSLSALRSLDITGSTLNILSTFSLGSSTIGVVDGTNTYKLAGGWISGGTIVSDAAHPLEVVASSRVSSVILDTDVLVQDGAALSAGAGTRLRAGRTITLVDAGIASPALTLSTAAVFENGSRVAFAGTGIRNIVRDSSFGSITVPAGLEFVTTTGSGSFQMSLEAPSTLTLTNNGSIRSITSGRSMNVFGGGVVNTGLFEASGGGTVTVKGDVPFVGTRGPVPFENRGGIVRLGAGGVITVVGSYNDLARTGGTATLDVTIAGTAASEFGRLSVSGVTRIDPTRDVLTLHSTPSLIANIGQSVRILSAGSLVGGPFARVEGLSIDAGRSFAVTYDATGVLARVTMPGDANLNNAVDFADLVVLAQQYNRASGQTWAGGDFTGDGATDFADLVVLVQHYSTTSGAPIVSSSFGDASAAFVSDWALARALVPEPASFGLLVVGTIAGRRNRCGRREM